MPIDTSPFAARRSPIMSGPYGIAESVIVAQPLDEAMKYSNSPPLYHYTTFESFVSICNSRKLWMGNCLYMNDREELSFAVRLLMSTIRETKGDGEHASIAMRLVHELNGILPTDVYILALTTNPQRLSQWRGYASPSGVAIGFGKNTLEKLCEENNMRLERVVYDLKSQTLKCQPLVERIFKEIDLDRIKSDIQYRSEVLKSVILEDFSRIAPTVKRGPFSEEDEWRIIAQAKSIECEQKVRCNNSRLYPYIELPFQPKEPVEPYTFQNLVVGPNTDVTKAIMSLQLALKQNEMTHHRIFESGIPYESAK